MNQQKKLMQQSQLVSVIVVSLLAAVIIIGFSLKKKPAVVITQATAELAESAGGMKADTDSADATQTGWQPEIKAVFHRPGRIELYADGKLFTMLKDSAGWGEPSPTFIDADLMQLNYILYENDETIMGGKLLQMTNTDYMDISYEHDFGAPVNVILKFGEGFLVGANTGLYYYDAGRIDTLLKGGLLVNALAEDEGGLWVGTFGDGLWRFDGEKWQRRYLLRDTSIFDFVTALEYCYPYLWVGTPCGIFRFDGGKWQQLFESDSTEEYEVNCIMPRVFTPYIGTEQGLFVFANDSLHAVPEFECEQVMGIFKDNKDILVATRINGIYKLPGKEEILRPEQLKSHRIELAENK
jgi:hypothetical protein